MESWYHSDIIHTRMEDLIKRGLLRGRTEVVEWLVPGREEAPSLSDGYGVFFAPYHECGSFFRRA